MVLCLSRGMKPLILLPPMYGTNLYATYNNTELPFYCPKTMNDEHLWVHPRFVIPPLYNCLFKALCLDIDNETGEISDLPNISISIHDFGGDEAVRYVDSGIFGYHFIESLAFFIDYFKEKGYTMKKDLFAAPYDWRRAISALGGFWDQFKSLTEHAYQINDNQKVTLFGFSTGGYILQRFLTEHVDKKWKDKYVDKIILLAPSFGGATVTMLSIWTKISPLLPFINSTQVNDMVESMMVVHAHLPNHVVFGNRTVFRGPYDEDYTAAELRDLFVKNRKITGKYIKLFDMSVNESSKDPVSPDVPTLIILNTGVDTVHSYHFKQGWDKTPTEFYGRGDGTLPSIGPMYACENWSSEENPIICIDLFRDSPIFNHQPLGSNPFVHELVFNATLNEEWPHLKKRIIKRAPFVDVINGTHFVILEERRPWRTLL